MSLEAELYEERRRQWRRSAFWRGVLVTLGVLVALSVIGAMSMPDQAGRPSTPHIVTHQISGVIFNDPERDLEIAELAEDDAARALILYIESPGGTTVGSEGLHAALAKLSAEKPVVAVMGEVAASGGYIAALPADHIIARGNTLTGSIGVILQYPNLTELMDRLGVEMETFRSSELKGGPSPFRDSSEAERNAEAAIVTDAFAWFRDLVATDRGLSGTELDAVANGQVFTGRQALTLGLIDEIGGLEEAESWLASVDSSFADLPQAPLFEPQDDPNVIELITDWASAGQFLPHIGPSSGGGLLSVLP
ncbi:MAG: signal peptide peptidase SppA [Pseudomonadota bacterium]